MELNLLNFLIIKNYIEESNIQHNQWSLQISHINKYDLRISDDKRCIFIIKIDNKYGRKDITNIGKQLAKELNIKFKTNDRN